MIRAPAFLGLLALLGILALPASAQQEASAGAGVVIRALDKLSGRIEDLELAVGATSRFERIEIDHAECRYPAGNPSGDAYALLRVRDLASDGVIFAGWMIASAPALSALDHARYDLWVLRCTTS